jgi:PEP-CTERM motif-containing protein
MKRARYLLACAVSVFVSTGVILGQDAVSFVLSPPPISRPIFEDIATRRISDPLLTTNPGWSGGTTDRSGVNSDPALFGQGAVFFVVFPIFEPSSPLFGSGLTLRGWDSSDSGFASATTGRPGLFLDRGVPPNFQVQPPWQDLSSGGFVKVQIQGDSSRRGGAFPPIPPLPANRESGLVAVPEPGTWGLMGLGAAVLFHGRRRRR